VGLPLRETTLRRIETLGHPNFADFYPNLSGGALASLPEAPRIWPPPLMGRYRRKSTKIDDTGPWSGGGQMLGHPNFTVFYPNVSGGALPLCAEGPRIWTPPVTGRYRRKSTKIDGTGPWSGDGQMLGHSNFAAFYSNLSGGALPLLSEAPRI
jgi:hypothetical protein